MDEAHLGAEVGGERGELFVGGVDAVVGLVDDEVCLREPLDQRQVERGVGADAEGAAACRDADGGRRDVVDRQPGLDAERAELDGGVLGESGMGSM